MSGAPRLARVIGMQHRLALQRLAQAQVSLAAAEARAGLLDDMAAGLIVQRGGHGAAHLAAQSEMAERLRGARRATAHSLTSAVAERDHCHRGAQRLELQQQRLVDRQALERNKASLLVETSKRQRRP